jgi:hypothetical protein
MRARLAEELRRVAAHAAKILPALERQDALADRELPRTARLVVTEHARLVSALEQYESARREVPRSWLPPEEWHT